MWDVTVPVLGRCPACGDDLETEITVRASADWVERYEREEYLRRSVDQAIVRLVVARHDPGCPGAPRRMLPASA
jgi:hypothetical protein